jgi:acyl-[acyl-carrier-protein] desaturase
MVYREYLDYLETAEKKRRWNIFDDIPWASLDPAKALERNAQCIEVVCAEELYVPDYSAQGLGLLRESFGMAWFQTCWAAEEARHGLVLREYLTRSGLRTQAEFAALERRVFAQEWRLPFATARQMSCYGALQEGVTYLAYKAQKERARLADDPVLTAIFHFVGRDEAAHGGFYRAVTGLELLQDRAGTIADLAFVVADFEMPGDKLIANYRQRLLASGASVSPRTFVERVLWPLLTTLGVGRHELKDALRQRRDTAAPVDLAQ